MKTIKVRFIKNDKYAYETEDDVAPNCFVWCLVKDQGGREYEQLAVVTDICDEAESEKIKKQLAEKNKILKRARKYIKKS